MSDVLFFSVFAAANAGLGTVAGVVLRDWWLSRRLARRGECRTCGQDHRVFALRSTHRGVELRGNVKWPSTPPPKLHLVASHDEETEKEIA